MLNSKQLVCITGFENLYKVSSNGCVYNNRKQMKTYKINSGYECIDLTLNGVKTKKLIHRLVAEHFIPNPENKKEVNHIDGNKLNNSIENLEWVTSKENKKHARDTGLSIYNLPTLGIKKGKGSTYFNVIYDKQRDKWIGTIRVNKKNYFPKRFDSEIEAAKHVNWIIDHLGLSDRPKNLFT